MPSRTFLGPLLDQNRRANNLVWNRAVTQCVGTHCSSVQLRRSCLARVEVAISPTDVLEKPVGPPHSVKARSGKHGETITFAFGQDDDVHAA